MSVMRDLLHSHSVANLEHHQLFGAEPEPLLQFKRVGEQCSFNLDAHSFLCAAPRKPISPATVRSRCQPQVSKGRCQSENKHATSHSAALIPADNLNAFCMEDLSKASTVGRAEIVCTRPVSTSHRNITNFRVQLRIGTPRERRAAKISLPLGASMVLKSMPLKLTPKDWFHRGTSTHQDLMTVHHRTRYLFVLQETKSTLDSAMEKHISR